MTAPIAAATRIPEAHHPDAERLALHAAGQLRRVERFVLEAHLAYCATCTDDLRALLDPGARWLESLPGEPPPPAVWASLERRLGEPGAGRSRPDGRNGPGGGSGATAIAAPLPAVVPASAWEEIADSTPVLQWRRLPTSRAHFARLAADPAIDAELVLVRLEPGSRFPAHVHLGVEEMVILAGGYSDPFGHFEAGAYQRYAPGTEHSALTDAGETCWAIGLIERGLRFRGVLGALQWLIDPRVRSGAAASSAVDRFRGPRPT